MITSNNTHKQILEVLAKGDITFRHVSWMSEASLLKINRIADLGWCRQLENGDVTITDAGRKKLNSY